MTNCFKNDERVPSVAPRSKADIEHSGTNCT